ncbi:unnamed protein product [Psylliodes chrysocephalus]|uniref:Uncharacterized protein n=1 Tax=Psylliodes chrysocephalus TaxID=3402493 RepID=A0A9P0G9W8_9CUCU|nr:unnamed protein product [Psylliodes chrysocephala]
MIWNEPMNHHDHCYFCLVKITGINRKNRVKWEYPSIQSAHRRDLSTKSTPEPQSGTLQQETEDFKTKEDSSDSDFKCDLGTPKPFSQDHLNDLEITAQENKISSNILLKKTISYFVKMYLD